MPQVCWHGSRGSQLTGDTGDGERQVEEANGDMLVRDHDCPQGRAWPKASDPQAKRADLDAPALFDGFLTTKGTLLRCVLRCVIVCLTRHAMFVKILTNVHWGCRMESSFEYIFPSIRGVQAGREYYVSMCPLRLIPKIFLFDEDELMPELRAQRILNKARIPEMSRYILDNREGYVFSAITASVDGLVRFKALGAEGEASRLGALHVDMSCALYY